MEASTPEAEAEPASPELIRDLAALRLRVAEWHSAGEKVAVVPTMGALHEGHLSLVRAAATRADRVIASVFVNPLQFAPDEDLQKYPRDLDRDLALLESAGCDALFTTTPEQMYPHGFATYVVNDAVARRLEGEFRPTHFRGVLTVVLAAIALTGMIAYRNLALVVAMVLLVIGANLPPEFTAGLHIDRDIMLATLIALILAPFVQRHLES